MGRSPVRVGGWGDLRGTSDRGRWWKIPYTTFQINNMKSSLSTKSTKVKQPDESVDKDQLPSLLFLFSFFELRKGCGSESTCV